MRTVVTILLMALDLLLLMVFISAHLRVRTVGVLARRLSLEPTSQDILVDLGLLTLVDLGLVTSVHLILHTLVHLYEDVLIHLNLDTLVHL